MILAKVPLERGPKRPQKCTIVDDCAQIAVCGLKPPLKRTHLAFPDTKKGIFGVNRFWGDLISST